MGFPGSSAGKESIHLQCRRPQFDSWVRKFPWRRDRLPTPVFLGFPGGSDHKDSTCNAGDLGSIPGLGRSPGGGHGNPLQYSCLENPMNRGAWWATVYGVTKSQIWLSDSAQHSIGETTYKHINTYIYVWKIVHRNVNRPFLQCKRFPQVSEMFSQNDWSQDI